MAWGLNMVPAQCSPAASVPLCLQRACSTNSTCMRSCDTSNSECALAPLSKQGLNPQNVDTHTRPGEKRFGAAQCSTAQPARGLTACTSCQRGETCGWLPAPCVAGPTPHSQSYLHWLRAPGTKACGCADVMAHCCGCATGATAVFETCSCPLAAGARWRLLPVQGVRRVSGACFWTVHRLVQLMVGRGHAGCACFAAAAGEDPPAWGMHSCMGHALGRALLQQLDLP